MRYSPFVSLLFVFSLFAQATTQPMEASEEYGLTQMRVLTTTEQTFFYKEVETTLPKIAETVGPIINDMEAALEKSGNKPEGNVTFVYPNMTHDMSKPFKLQVGMIVQKGAVEFGDFKVRQLPSVKAATVLFGGSLQWLGKAYETLFASIFSKGLQPTEEMRETYMIWEGPESPNNATQIQIVIKQ